MPIINVTLIEGRSDEQLRSLISELTQAAHRAVDAPLESIRVILNEVPDSHFAAANITAAERKQQS